MNRSRHLAALIVLLVSLAHLHGASSATQRIYLSGKGPSDAVEWDFFCSDGRKSGEWSKIPVPSNWEQHGFGSYDYGHILPDDKSDETGTYRVRFHAPADWKNKVVRLVFEGAMTDTTVKVNGTPIGSVHQGGYTEFSYTLSDTSNYGQHAFVPGTDNELEIHVAKKSSNASLEAAERKADYWVFGGIYRPVYLEILPKAFINRVAIDAGADGQFRMQVFPQVHLPRNMDGSPHLDQLTAQIETLDGAPVGSPMTQPLTGGGTSMVLLQSRVVNANTWSPEFPRLYRVRVALKLKGDTVHEIIERFGFRTFETRFADGLYLNGKKLKICGVNYNTFRPDTARAIDSNEAWADARAIKAMNANAVRCHLPPSKAFVEACDELGLLFITERTNWQRPVADTNVARDIVYELVIRDHNHPSLIMWANGNEGGFNHQVDELFSLLDLQKRPVIHPWASFDGIDTIHYLTYNQLEQRLAENRDILFPTEILHGLFDGGAGAGMRDYWDLMRKAPLSAGCVVWCWSDDAIERTDLNGKLDTDGNHSADGIVGPYGEKEASYYTIREIWSPIQIPLSRLPEDFDGSLPIENRFQETSLEQCHFQWKLIAYNDPFSKSFESRVIDNGTLAGPKIPPQSSGTLSLPVARVLKKGHTLELTATDPSGRELMTWAWNTGTATTPQTTKKQQLKQDPNNPFTILVGDTQWTFSPENGRLLNCIQSDEAIGLGQGPLLQASTFKNRLAFPDNWSAKVQMKNGTALIEAKNSDGSHFTWTLSPEGTVTLDYRFAAIAEAVAYCAVGFDLPENKVVSKRWSGDGPYRIWGNRQDGPQHGQWENEYNDSIPGSRWNYPCFKGIFANTDWMRVDLSSGRMLFFDPQGTANVGVLVPSNVIPDPDNVRKTGPISAAWLYPQDGGLFIFHKTPPVGSKFKEAPVLGPQSRAAQIIGPITGTIQFEVR